MQVRLHINVIKLFWSLTKSLNHGVTAAASNMCTYRLIFAPICVVFRKIKSPQRKWNRRICSTGTLQCFLQIVLQNILSLEVLSWHWVVSMLDCSLPIVIKDPQFRLWGFWLLVPRECAVRLFISVFKCFQNYLLSINNSG